LCIRAESAPVGTAGFESFKHDGTEYVAGDRVPVRHRAIRRIAAQSPQFFRMEFATADLDLEWLASLEVDAEGRYEAVKRRREGEKDRRERALRDELKSHDRRQPELERRFKEQEAERRRREKEVREEIERREIEREIEYSSDLRSGFNP
jgi:hypothetical protein